MSKFATITGADWRTAIARARSTPNQLSAQIRARLMQATSAKGPETADRSGRGAACANSAGPVGDECSNAWGCVDDR